MKTKLLFTFLVLLSLQFITAQNIGFLGNFNNWGDDVDMSTSDNINYTITGYYLPSTGLKFRENNDWTNNWGGDNFPVGTTTANDIPVTSNYYDIAFNINTGDYSFSPSGPSNQNISVIGNGYIDWNTDLALTTTDNIIYSVLNIPLVNGGELKFRRDANWSVSYGGSGLTGTASPTAGNIAITTSTNYDITFNIESLEYSIVETVLGLDDFNKNVNMFYINNTLKINGYNGKASIRTFDISGRLLQSIKNLQIQNNFSQKINLPKNQLSFIVIEGENFIKTLKVIAY